MIEPVEPPPWVVPQGWAPYNLARCRACNAQIMWCVTTRGARAPVDRDGTNHFATCSDPKRFRRKR